MKNANKCKEKANKAKRGKEKANTNVEMEPKRDEKGSHDMGTDSIVDKFGSKAVLFEAMTRVLFDVEVVKNNVNLGWTFDEDRGVLLRIQHHPLAYEKEREN